MSRVAIRDRLGKTLGFTNDEGAKIRATTFLGKTLGFYNKSTNKTTDFYGRVVCTGDGTVGLIMESVK